MKRLALIFTICSLLVPAFMIAQENAGRITGTVQDESEAVIPGVPVVVRNVATGARLEALTGDSGIYTFPTVSVGEYTVTATLPGFKTVEQTGLRVVSGEGLTVNLVLSVGEVTETVTVAGDVPVIDTQSSGIAVTRVLEEISNLPLAMEQGARNSKSFMRTLPGVLFTTTQADIVVTETAIIGGAGGGLWPNSGSGSYKIDGINAAPSLNAAQRDDSAPIPEVIEEFRMSTNRNAEEGWDNGASIELVFKSGTNRFHGTAFEYFRNDVLDARNFFAADVDPHRQNEFGIVVGGPIIKDKLFFFASYTGFRLRTAPAGVIQTVPTPNMRNGDFSEFLGAEIGTDVLGRPIFQGQIYDPMTTRPDGQGGFIRDPFPNNTIPSNRFSPISLHYQAGYPAPNQPGVQNNWNGSQTASTIDMDKPTLKLDAELGRHRLSFGYDDIARKNQLWPGVAFDPEIGSSHFADSRQWRFRFSDYWTLRPNLLFGFRTGISRNTRTLGTQGLPSAVGATNAGLEGTLDTSTPAVNTGGRTSGFGFPFLQLSDPAFTVPVSMDLAWTKGDHSYKFGLQVMQQITGSRHFWFTNGAFSFRDAGTGLVGVDDRTGNGYASYLLGDVNNLTMQGPQFFRDAARAWGFFAQDSWRVTPKLTLNYGLRYDFGQPIVESYDRYGTFDPDIPNPGAAGFPGAITFNGEGQGRNGRRTLLDNYGGAVGPRLGIAYALDSKTVIRAYYGLFQILPLNDFSGLFSLQHYGWSAAVATTTTDGGLTPAFNWEDGVPLEVLPNLPSLDPALQNGGGVQWIDPEENRYASAQNLGFGVERELGWNMAVRAEYVGKLNHHLRMSYPVNEIPLQHFQLGPLLNANIHSPEALAAGIPVPYAGFNGSVGQALRPFPQFTSVSQDNSRFGSTFYHSLQASAQKRFGQGLNFLLSYTLSKNLYTALGPHPGFGIIKSYPNLFGDNGDRTHSLALSYNYELPFGPSRRFLSDPDSFVRHLVANWTFVGSHNYFSGPNVRLSGWVNRVEGVPIETGIGPGDFDPNDPSRNQTLNPDAFEAPAPFTFGNTRVLPNVRSFPYSNENFSILKKFPISEDVNVLFGAEFYNAFNRVSWIGLQTNIFIPSSFGTYNGTLDGRAIQMRLHINW